MEDPGRKLLALLGGVAVLAGLYWASEYNYLLFHTLAEGFSIVVACGIFMVAWNSRRFLQNNYVLFLGVAYLFVGGLDLVHTLAYKGMNVFPGYDANLPTQLWISARYMEALSLLAAPLFIGRRLSAGRALAVYAAVSAVLLWAIFSGHFPACFVEGSGLTPFKKASEYVISGILVGSLYTLYRRRRHFDPGVLRLIYASIAVTIAAEMAFTFYVSAYGLSNLVGHYLKILSFVLIYRAVIMTGLREPYNLLFRDLKLSEEKYQSLFTEMLNGFAYNRVITDESGKPVDSVFLE
ncbi:MAG: MASE3 domain-containing protein, partial [Nitrospirota bacterium]